tara:strand:+ start:53456 stop:53749 length:294 start_codon:yes stop_codon:yes gene_type:complete
MKTGNHNLEEVFRRLDEQRGKIQNLEFEIRYLRLAVSQLTLQDVSVLTALRDGDSTEVLNAYDNIKSTLKYIWEITDNKREIGAYPFEEEDPNGRED